MGRIKQNLWNRGTVFGWHGPEGEERPAAAKHPIFGLAPHVLLDQRVKVIAGDVYSAAFGAAPMTREQLLEDPYVKEGTINAPPAEVVAMLSYETWDTEIDFISDYGSLSGSFSVSRGYTTIEEDGELTEPEIAVDACKAFAPDGDFFSPEHESEFPSRFQADHLQTSLANILEHGGSYLPVLTSNNGGVVAGVSEPGTLETVELDSPVMTGDPAEPYVFRFNQSTGSEVARVSAVMASYALYLSKFQLWVLPVSVTAISEQINVISPIYDSLYYTLIEDSENFDALNEFEADTISDFEDANPSTSLQFRAAGVIAYSAAPVPLVEFDADLFSAATFENPTFFRQFQDWES